MNCSSPSVARTSALPLHHADAARLIQSAVRRLSVDSLSGQVSLWTVRLDQLSPAESALFEWLSPDERSRAQRFHFERDQRRFVLGRGCLRWLLSESLNVHPADLEFVYGPAGKPALAGCLAGAVQFNLAHSEGLMVCAVSGKAEVGVDVERIREVPEAGQILEAHFPIDAVAVWRRLPNEQQPEAFLRLWVRHEARVKSSGRGLAQPEAEESRLATDESVFEFAPAAGFVGALAVNWG